MCLIGSLAVHIKLLLPSRALQPRRYSKWQRPQHSCETPRSNINGLINITERMCVYRYSFETKDNL